MREPQQTVTRAVKWLALDGLLFFLLFAWIVSLRWSNVYATDGTAAWPSPSDTRLQLSVGVE